MTVAVCGHGKRTVPHTDLLGLEWQAKPAANGRAAHHKQKKCRSAWRPEYLGAITSLSSVLTTGLPSS
jgi:hypothetical protein